MFLIKTTAFYSVVWLLTKALTTWGSLYYPVFINRWYDLNHQLVASVPHWGQTLRALLRDNVADGTLAFWEVWIGLGLVVALVRVATKSRV